MARREERAYREYVSDEQRRQPGCIGGQICVVISALALRERSSVTKSLACWWLSAPAPNLTSVLPALYFGWMDLRCRDGFDDESGTKKG